MGKPTLPNLLIVGAAKAGTTSLHHYLSQHPQIFMSKKKELNFFDGLRWDLGLDWYKSNFDDSYGINGEASPRYTRHPELPNVPERIRQVLGTPKLIYIIRDPVDRILSNYTQSADLWLNSRPFDIKDLQSDRAIYVHCSSYFSQLTQYMKIFKRESILVLINERLNAQPKETLRRAFRFLGVDEDFWAPDFEERKNVGDRKRFAAPWFERYAPDFLKEQMLRPTWMPWKGKQALYKFSRIGGKDIRKPKITREDDLRLQDMLKADVSALRDFLDDPLPEWRPYV